MPLGHCETRDSCHPPLEDVPTLPHAHKDGVTCEEHCRCGVLLAGTLVTVDVPAWFVGTLPEREFVLDGPLEPGG